MKLKAKLFDIFFPTFLVFIFTFQPYFFHGIIDIFESSVYLPFINEVLRGRVIFKDMVILRGPLEIYLPAFLMLIFGKHINVLTACFYLGNVLTLVFIVFLARHILRTRVFLYLFIPVLVAKTFSLVYYKNWGGFRFALGVISVWCILKFLKSKKSIWIFSTGLFSALGFLFSPDMGIFSFLTAAITLCIFTSKEKLSKNISFYILGFVIIILPFLLYFIYTGGIIDYLRNLSTMPRSAYKVYHFEILFPDMPHNPLEALRCLFEPFKPNFRYFLPIIIYLTIGVYLFKSYIKKRRLKQNYIVIFPVALFGLLMYFGSFRQINGPQFAIAFQPALLILFVILERIFIFLKKKQLMMGKKFGYAFLRCALYLLIFSLVFTSVFIIKNYINYGLDVNRVVFRQISKGDFPSDTAMKSLNIKRAKGILVPAWQADEINSVVSYIEKVTDKKYAVLSFPDQSVYNFFFDRPSFSRFGLSDIASYRQDWTDEFFSQLEIHKPHYIVARIKPDMFEPVLSKYPIVKNRDEIRNFIKNNYNLEVYFGKIGIYRLKDK